MTHHPPMPQVPQSEMPPRPPKVDQAFWFILAGTVLGSIGTALSVLDPVWVDTVVRQVTSEVPDLTSGQAGQLRSVVVVGGFLGIALVIGLYVLLAFKMRAGRNWARVVLAVLTGFSAANFLLAAAQSSFALSLIWNLADVALCGIAVVYLYSKECAPYFAKPGAGQGQR